MYIADTGNRRIVRYRMDTGAVEFLGEGLLRQPTGVCVAHDGRIFVADYGGAVVVLSNSGDAVLSTITKPETVLYGAPPLTNRKSGCGQFRQSVCYQRRDPRRYFAV